MSTDPAPRRFARIVPRLRGFRRLLVPPLLAAAWIGAAPAGAQQPPGFGEVVDVRLVNVEAWVTDAKGRPIRGLRASDFELYEDGRPVEITHFAEVGADGEAAAEGPEAGPEPTPDTAPSARPGAAAAAPVEAATVWPNHLVLYFDDLHLTPISRRRMLDDLRDYVASGEAPAGRILVMRQERDLYTEVPFGASPVEVELSLDRIAERAFSGALTSQEKRLAVSRLQDLWRQAQEAVSGPVAGSPCDYFLPRAVPIIEVYVREASDRIEITLGHLASVVSFLAGVPGVKTVLFMSDRLEATPGSDLIEFVRIFCPTQSVSLEFSSLDSMSRAMVALTRHANANRVTIYALQGSGLRGGTLMSADQAAVEPRGITRFQSSQRAAERDGLVMLASQTGGRAIFNRNRIAKTLAEIGGEMDRYYSLGYAPPHDGDGRNHEIEVRVRWKGAKVRHRLGYRDKLADERLRERLLSALYLGQVSNPLGVRLGQGRVIGTSSGKYLVPLHVMVPDESVAFLPGDSGDSARLLVRVLVRTGSGERVADEVSTFEIERPPPDYDRPLDLPVELALGEGLNIVAVALRDEATHEASFVSTSFVLGRAEGR